MTAPTYWPTGVTASDYVPGPMTGRMVLKSALARADVKPAPPPLDGGAQATLVALREHGPCDAAHLAIVRGLGTCRVRSHLATLRQLGVAAVVESHCTRRGRLESGGDVWAAVQVATLAEPIARPDRHAARLDPAYLDGIVDLLQARGPLDVTDLSLRLAGSAMQSNSTRVRTALMVLVAEGRVVARDLPREVKLRQRRRVYEVAP